MNCYFIEKNRALWPKNKLQEALSELSLKYNHHLSEDITAFIENMRKQHQEIVSKYPRCKAEEFRTSKHDDTVFITLGENVSFVAHLVKGTC